MKRIYTKEVKPGRPARVAGWVSTVRDLGNIKFFLLRDREGVVQVTAKKGVASEKLLAQVLALGKEDVVSVQGEAVASAQAPGGREIFPEKITLLNTAATPLPIDVGEKIESSLDKRLDWRPLDLRNPRNLAIFKVQSALVEGMASFLRKKGFLQVFTPCLMGAPSESGSDVFPVFYFNREVYLRQDPQLHRQLAIAGGLDRIFDLGPSWRAEASHTSRHLCEHRGLAPEMALQKDEQEVMKIQEGTIVSGFQAVKKSCGEELALLGKALEIPDTPFPELRFPEVLDLLKDQGKILPPGADLDREGEKLLAEYVKKKHGSDLFFVNRFPYQAKPFYVMKAEGGWARSVDLVYKGVELSSGGQREHRHDRLLDQVREKGIPPESLDWFTRHFRFGVPPHGGFCIGIERLTMQLLDIENVREAVLFARTPDRALP